MQGFLYVPHLLEENDMVQIEAAFERMFEKVKLVASDPQNADKVSRRTRQRLNLRLRTRLDFSPSLWHCNAWRASGDCSVSRSKVLLLEGWDAGDVRILIALHSALDNAIRVSSMLGNRALADCRLGPDLAFGTDRRPTN